MVAKKRTSGRKATRGKATSVSPAPAKLVIFEPPSLDTTPQATAASLPYYGSGPVEVERVPYVTVPVSRLTPKPASEAGGPWSKPDTPKRWSKVFGVSVDTVKRQFKKGEIPNRKLSDRSYMVRLDCIPADK